MVSSDDKSSKTLASFPGLSLSEAEGKIRNQLTTVSNSEARLNKEELLISNKAHLDSEIGMHESEYKRKRIDGPESRIGKWEPITATENTEYRYFGQAV